MEEKLKQAVNIAQKYILLLLNNYLTPEQLFQINELFKNCSVEFQEIPKETSLFKPCGKVAGLATNDRIIIDSKKLKYTNLAIDIERDNLVGTIIHEYAHKIRRLNNNYGEMLEESFATIFAELCINNAKLNDKSLNQEAFTMATSYEYQKYESEVRALLYILKQHNLDKQMIIEYITNQDNKFKNVCEQILGFEFSTYFNTISNKNNQNSEQLLINLLSKYIRKNGIDLKSYWDNGQNLENNLYVIGSKTLSKAVVEAGIESLSEDQKEYYKPCQYWAEYYEKEEKLDNEVYFANIRATIEKRYSIVGKTKEEIYDTILDLCSDYIFYKSKDDKDSKTFINEIERMFPEIEDFKAKFIMLRRIGKDSEVLENIDITNPTYIEIYNNINFLVDKLKNNISR